jgi:hypothetical protein
MKYTYEALAVSALLMTACGGSDVAESIADTKVVKAAAIGNTSALNSVVCGVAPTQSYANQSNGGTAGADTIVGTQGNDSIDGGTGTDTVVYACPRASYAVTKTATGWTVASIAEGTDTLTNVERIQFADFTLAMDIDGTAGQAYRVYQAAFNRTPDNDGLKFWINAMDGGASLQDVATGFVNSAEFVALYGANPSNTDFLTRLYSNVLHRTPDVGGYNWWLNTLNTAQATKTGVLMGFSDSPENKAGVLSAIQNGISIRNGPTPISSTRTGIAADSNAAYPVCSDEYHSWASLDAEYAYVDKLKAAGYSGITIDYNVNVSATGQVLNTFKHERIWVILAYAKSIGMTPNLKVHWGNPASPGIVENQCGNLNTWTTPVNGFDMNLFLAGVKAHFAEYAPKAEAAGVKLMFLGTENDNLVSAQYHAQWADIVATIRASFKGTISYDGAYLGVTYQPFEQVGIWDLVDKIGLSFYPALQPTPATTVAEVVEKYVSRPAQYCSPTKCDNTYAIPNIIQHIRALSAKYGKEVIIGEANWAAYEATLAGFVEPQSLQAQGKLVLNENQRQLAYGAFFEVMNNPNYLGGVVTGVNIWGNDFWVTRPGMPANWALAFPITQLPGTPTEEMIKPFITCNKSACL